MEESYLDDPQIKDWLNLRRYLIDEFGTLDNFRNWLRQMRSKHEWE